MAAVAGLIGAAALTLALWGFGAFDDSPRVATTAATGDPVVEIREIVTPDGETTSAAAVARKVVPSIVTVDVGTDLNGEFSKFGSGSGVVLTVDGLIVTNHHVLEDAELVEVVFEDGRTYPASIVGSDRRTDLAVLRIDAAGLTPIASGATDGSHIGDVAIAVGSPLGLDGGPSVTVGVISAFGRQVQTGPDPNVDTLFDMLQTDAPITQGSSGGALVNGAGELIGITSAIGISSAGAEGIGFAIPIELVTRITDELIETGTVHHAFLGVQLDTASRQAADGAEVPAGALVVDFALEDGAARQAGVAAGDLVVAYDTTPVATKYDLISGLRRLRVGDTVTLTIVREGERLEIPVVLQARPDDL
jgi:putative serine protease PepD